MAEEKKMQEKTENIVTEKEAVGEERAGEEIAGETAAESENIGAEESSGMAADEKPDKLDRKSRKEFEKKLSALEKERTVLSEKLEENEKSLLALKDTYLRLLAEFDNYKKRTQNEKAGIYADAAADVVNSILPVMDTLELALAYTEDSEGVVKGVSMTLTQFRDCLAKIGVSEIGCEKFDPTLHDAVMHIEDDQYEDNTIVQVLRKGYIKDGKVIRHAMVKVAN